MEDNPACPICTLTGLLDAACGHEWQAGSSTNDDEHEQIVKDGNAPSDAVTVIEDLEVRESSAALETGTRAEGIRVVAGGHDVDRKVDGMGSILKAKFLEKT